MPNVDLLSSGLKLSIVIIQLAIRSLDDGRYGPVYLRMAVIIRDGVLPVILFMQLKWYRYGKLYRMRKANN